MKRLLILLLVLAIVVSLASITFAVYMKSVSVPVMNVGNKVFNVFAQPAYSVTEPRAAVHVPEWQFTVFNSVTYSRPSDLSITVTFNTASTSGLVVDVLIGGTVIGSSNFDGYSSVTLLFPGYIGAGSTIRQNLTLRFSYNGMLISPSNHPFGGTTAYYSVLVSAQPQEDLIEKVRGNRWVRMEASPGTGNRVNFIATLFDPPDSASASPNNTRTGTIRLEYSAADGSFTIRRNSGALFTFTGIDPGSVITPTGIVIYGSDFSYGKTLTISGVTINGAPVSGSFLFDSAEDAHLFTGLTPDADGSFYISFDYAYANGGYTGSPYFGIYLGYT
ncbi:MAG: hypothetical protein GXY43_04135 [Clostridiaceae bacterium]|nr:hypothetical protein [Clostridiaceae bacterium]